MEDYSTVELIFEDAALYTNVFNTLFKTGVISLIEIDLIGSGNTATKILSIEGIKSMIIENKLSYASSKCSEIVVRIEAGRVYQFNTEESVELFPKQ